MKSVEAKKIISNNVEDTCAGKHPVEKGSEHQKGENIWRTLELTKVVQNWSMLKSSSEELYRFESE